MDTTPENDNAVRCTRAAESLADICHPAGLTVATAESLTGGTLASFLSAAPGAAQWFRGGIVAYADDVKHQLLEVPAGPVVSAEGAIAMATATRRLLGADLVVSVTGAGGPEPQDDQPVGTVCFAVAGGDSPDAERRLFDGDPEQVVYGATLHALDILCSRAGTARR